MKCLFYCPSYPPPLIGGSLVYYYYLHTTFTENELIVLTAKKLNAEAFDKEQHYPIIRKEYIKIEYIQTANIAKAINLAQTLFMSLHLMLSNNVDVIHIGQFYPGAFMGWLVSIITGKPWVLTVMGEDLTGIYTAGPLRRKMVLAALQRATRVLTISKYTVKILIEHGVEPGRITMLTPGFDSAKCNANGTKEPSVWSGIKDKSILLTVGRLTERKGQDMVLRALPGIIKDHPDVHYVIAGAGLEEARLKDMVVDLGLQKHVTIITDAADEEIAFLYQHCRVFIMPNRELANGDTEGFGIVFLEAGWWGKPVIGGRVGGVPDAVEDGVTGLLVDGNNPVSIANAIKDILINPVNAGKMGNAGREKAIKCNWLEKSHILKSILNNVCLR